mgnify:FL=1
MWLCIRLPRWALDCLHTESSAAAVIDKQTIVCINTAAHDLGIRTQQSLAHALQLAGTDTVLWLPRDPLKETSGLEALISWAYRYTPTLYRDFGHNVLLKIGPSLRLFKGVENLLTHLQTDLAHHLYDYRLGVSQSPIRAWLASFLDTEGQSIKPADLVSISGLGLEHFNTLHPKDIKALQMSGIQTIGDLVALPTSELRKRCSKAFMRHIEQLKGEQEAYIADHQPPAYFRHRFRFGYDVKDTQELWPGIDYLLQGLSAFLQQTQHRTDTLEWRLEGIHRYRETFEIRSSQAHSRIEPWLGLLSIHLETLALKEPIDALQLSVDRLLPINQEPSDLFGGQQGPSKQTLTDQLRTRLGHQAIKHIRLRNEHIPEFAQQLSAESEDKHPSSVHEITPVPRPVWLLDPPVNTSSDHSKQWINGELKLILGPERIEDFWWETPQCRDYYIAIDEHQYRFWVFQDRHQKTWFLHGIFD